MEMFVLLFALTAARADGDCKPQFAPLRSGTYSATSRLPSWRKDEAREWSGDGWLGWSGSSGTLERVRLVVRETPGVEANDQEQVTVEAIPNLDFAVRCIRGLRPGPIRTTRVTNVSLLPDRPLTISLGSLHYELRVRSARADLADARVILTDGGRSQLLYSANGFADEPHFDINWAGDLDCDGKLDLVVNLNRKYSVHPYRLLLSTKAARGQLVGEAGVFETLD